MDEVALLGETVERLLLDHSDRPAGPGGFNHDCWRSLLGAGFTRVGVPAAVGGDGGPIVGAQVVLDRLGWAGTSAPVAEAMVAGWLCASARIQLPGGVVTLCPARPGDAITIEDDRAGSRVKGTAARVPWAVAADHLVVTSPRDGDLVVAVVPADAAIVVEGRNVAGEGRDRVELRDVVVPGAQVGVAPGLSGDQVLRWGAMCRAAQLAGALRRATELTRDHVATRIQFGRALKSFQHTRMRVAEMAEEVAAASAAAAAAMAGTGGEPSLLEVAAAKVCTARAAGIVAAAAHQLHGAIGFTDEHPLHRLTTRAWAWRDEFGTEGWWAERLGSEVATAGASALWPSVINQSSKREGSNHAP